MSREVMQQALDALENGAIARPGWVPDYDDAITSLRAALAEQDDDLTAAWMAENEALREANEAFGKRQEWWNEQMVALEQQRDALTEALKDVLRYVPSVADGAIKARAAIAKAEGGSMTTLREAAQQALEALEFANVNHWWGSLTIEKAITALRAALAQQDDPTDPGHDVDVLREPDAEPEVQIARAAIRARLENKEWASTPAAPSSALLRKVNKQAMLEKAAKIVGRSGEYFDESYAGGEGIRSDELSRDNFNPLEDLHDAMWLLIEAKVELKFEDGCVGAKKNGFWYYEQAQPYNYRWYETVCLAIVRAAAEIEKGV